VDGGKEILSYQGLGNGWIYGPGGFNGNGKFCYI